jgi:ring-1,2-phenylacetyl-CoA epoxidase subunit PaaD
MVSGPSTSLRYARDDKAIWAWLGEIPDPEIPVISITDLGIVREVRWETDTLVVALTPTYSGCPATEVIRDDVVRALHERGIASVRVETRLAPAWTTDWLTARGRERLRDFGIAPPHAAGLATGPIVLSASEAPRPSCPHCNASDTTEISRFGSTPCKALYRCDACREPFDYMKPH